MPSASFNSVVAQASAPQVLNLIEAVPTNRTVFDRIGGYGFPGQETPCPRMTGRGTAVAHEPGAAIASSYATYVMGKILAKDVTARVKIPVDIARAHNMGEAVALANAMRVAMVDEFLELERLLFQGDASTPGEFDGLGTLHGSLAGSQVIDFGGDAAGMTSIYAIALASEEDLQAEGSGAQGLAWGIGGGGAILMGDWVQQLEPEFDENGTATGNDRAIYFNQVTGKVGLHIGSPFATAALVNVDLADKAALAELPDALDELEARIRVTNRENIIFVSSASGVNAYKAALRKLGGYIEPRERMDVLHNGRPFVPSDFVPNNTAQIVA